MDLSQGIYFWNQISLKMLILWEITQQKKNITFFGLKKSWIGYKNKFEFKMLKLFENHVKAKSLGGFLIFLI